MYNHALENYKCPICLAIQGVESDGTLLKQADLVFKDDLLVYLSILSGLKLRKVM